MQAGNAEPRRASRGERLHDVFRTLLGDQQRQRDAASREGADGVADAAEARIAEEGAHVCRTREPDSHGERDAAVAEAVQPAEDRRPVEAELGHDEERQVRPAREIDLRLERLPQGEILQPWMAFRIAGDADRPNAVRLHDPGPEEREAGVERPERVREIAGDRERALDPRLVAQTSEEIDRAVATRDLA